MTAMHDAMTLHDAIFPIPFMCARTRTHKGYAGKSVMIRHVSWRVDLRILTLVDGPVRFGTCSKHGSEMALPDQIAMFPRRALVVYPNPAPGMDTLGMVEADDGQLYYVKADVGATPTRASEWLCTGLAEAVGISAPTPAVIEMPDGSTVFGSRRVAGAADTVVTASFLTAQSIGNLGQQPVAGLIAVTSAIFAFDMFLFNDDRHFGNFLSQDDNGTRRLYAYDFSHALFYCWPWTGFPPANCNTQVCGRFIRSAHGFDPIVANSTLDRLDAISPVAIEHLFKQMPASWLASGLSGQFLSWWGAARSARIIDLRKGISDGSLL